ncbi:ribonuclease P protein component [Bdellovibrionota bacterium FG-1]
MIHRIPQFFEPEKRLHYSWEYRLFFAKNQVIRLSECTVFRIPNKLGHFRLGVTLKARGNSVERNRTKRQIRENFRVNADVLGSFDYNVVVPGSRKMTHPYPLKLGACLKRELRNAVAFP